MTEGRITCMISKAARATNVQIPISVPKIPMVPNGF